MDKTGAKVMTPDGNGWEEWRKHVLHELERLATGQEKTHTLIAENKNERIADYNELRKDFAKLCAEVAINRTKIAMIGAISGLVAGGIMSIILMLIERSIP